MPPSSKPSKRSPKGSSSASSRSDAASTRSRSQPTASTRSAHTLLSSKQAQAAVIEEDHPDLLELEERLNEQVDEEFFEDPRRFHTLHRVIDVLGMQLDSKDAWMGGGGDGEQKHDREYQLESNPAYKVLKQQQQVVEEAIEHLALIHCADLNGSVVQVGRVARQFHDAVTQVRHLRKQVKEIQETLGASDNNNNNVHGANTSSAAAASSAQSAMSLRELWLKKLEAEAVLSLLDKLDRIRAAPRQFDSLLQQHRIGAAVVTVAQALDTMFSSDVAQVQALHKIMEQLMIRKQKAEEVVWDLLLDIIFLRTGNGQAEALAAAVRATNQAVYLSNVAAAAGTAANAAAAATAKKLSIATTGAADSADAQGEYYDDQPYGMVNPFLNAQMRFAVTSDLQVEAAAAGTAASAAKDEEDWQEDDVIIQDNMMIPMSVMEADFDLESEERRHLEEQRARQESAAAAAAAALSSSNYNNKNSRSKKRPQYGDHVLALRTLVECLIRLRRLDDVERILSESMAKEVEALVQREQARTFLRVEGSTSHQLSRSGGRYAMLLSKAGATTDLRDFRQHLNSVVSAFGNVQLRLAHLAQIIRQRLVSHFVRELE